MEHLEGVSATMPPPQSPGLTHTRTPELSMQHHQVQDLLHHASEMTGKKQRVLEENEVSANMQVVNGKKQCMSDESDGPASKTLVTTAMKSEDYKTHSNPVTIWKECNEQLLKVLETSSNEWLSHWRELHEEDKAAMAHIRALYSVARDMNVNFHQQLDSLHNTVVDVVSSFKK
nr:uncharacterized protein LOC123769721 [Procambarus clarkii]